MADENFTCIMRAGHLEKESGVIDGIAKEPNGKVNMKTLSGGNRIVDMPAREHLPEIYLFTTP